MDKIEDCLKSFASFFPKDFIPEIAIVLGTRLSEFTSHMKNVRYIDFSEIKGFPVATGYGHMGRFALGYVYDVPIIVSDGRLHYYEGYTMNDVVLNIRLMHHLGAKLLIETNISGIVNTEYNVGDIMIIKDQISFLSPSPLIGINPRFREERFVGMCNAYDKHLIELLIDCAEGTELKVNTGTYIQVTGPNYETPAEVSALRMLGADAVGMSTACEVIVARQLGMRICGISYLSNIAGVDIDCETRKSNLMLAKVKAEEIYKLMLSFIKKIKDTQYENTI